MTEDQKFEIENLAVLTESLVDAWGCYVLTDGTSLYDEQTCGQVFLLGVKAMRHLVTAMARAGLLAGTEYCNECGEVAGIVESVEREPDLMIVLKSGARIPVDDLIEHYFRLPGSDAYGERAVVEIARARAVDLAA